MPTLQFKGKNIIWNHHLSIPYHTLEEVSKLNFQAEKGAGNLIIEGDNLLALKALLPQYAGKIKCIYIDPPYNTGNEDWRYNDRVNSPLIKEWLGKEVAKDDLTRHDKWLCMMVPRLRLLRDLLRNDGLIFVSIDDNEIHRLRFLMDEIFGEDNYVHEIIWKNKYGPGALTKGFGNVHEYIICYSRTPISSIEATLSEEDAANYKLRDDKYELRGGYLTQPLATRSKDPRPNLVYPIKHKGEDIWPDKQWIWEKERMMLAIKNDEVVFNKSDNEKWSVRFKQYLKDENGKIRKGKPISIFNGPFNQDGTWAIEELFGNKDAFNNPKPVELLKRLINFIVNDDESKDFIMLDSFAGSGTSMHAIIDLNKEDGGNRKCIMVQMTEATEREPKKNICKDITRERVKRAIDKYGYKSGFKYLRVGDPIDAETMLSGTLPAYRQFAKYVYYLCTGEYLQDESSIDEKTYFVGMHKKQAIYLIYMKDYDTLTRLALNLDVAESIIKEQKGKKIICYAPACFLDEEYLEAKNIEFVGIPYNLFRRNGQ